MHDATLSFQYPETIAKAIAGALSPERADAGPAADVPKTRTEITLSGGELRIRILADDLPSMRAAINSYCRWVDAAARATDVARVR